MRLARPVENDGFAPAGTDTAADVRVCRPPAGYQNTHVLTAGERLRHKPCRGPGDTPCPARGRVGTGANSAMSMVVPVTGGLANSEVYEGRGRDARRECADGRGDGRCGLFEGVHCGHGDEGKVVSSLSEVTSSTKANAEF